MDKKILYIARADLPDGNALTRRVVSNCVMLQNAGYSPQIVGYTHQQIKVGAGRINGIPYYAYRYPINTKMWIEDLLNLCRFVDRDHSYPILPYGVVLCCVGAWNSYNIYRWAKKRNIAVAVDSVDYFNKFSGNIIERHIKKFDQWILVHIINRCIHNNICISTWYSQLYNSVGCRTVVIPSLATYDNIEINEYMYDESGVVKFVYVGNPGYRCSKDRLDWCISSFLETQDYGTQSFDIFGISEDDYCAQFPEYESKIRTADRITFHGYQPNDTCANYISHADYFVFAREDSIITRAGFPTKLSEALSRGTPVVTTPSGDVPRYITDGINGFISEACTKASYKKAWERAIHTSKTKCAEMHYNCRTDRQLSTEKWQPLFKDFINSIMNERERKFAK